MAPTLAIAPAAFARSISFDGNRYVYDAAPGEPNHPLVGLGPTGDTIFFELLDPLEMLIIDPSAAAHRCNHPGIELDTVMCPTLPNITFNLGDQDDQMQGGPANEIINGGPGNDTINGGGDGNDVIDGGPGNDRFDESLAGGGADTFIGGDGRDELVYSDLDGNGRTAPVTVILDGRANDGQLRQFPEGQFPEGDNVGSDIEFVAGGNGSDVLIGDDGPNELSGGLAGDLGNDIIDGRGGDDILTGGNGSDRLSGGNGNDVIYARDGFPDFVACGPGFDRAIVDQFDSLSQDPLETCEVVDQAATGGGSAGGPGGGVGARARATLKAPRTIRLRKLLRKGLPIQVVCPTPCSVDSKLYLRARVARKLGLSKRKPVLLGETKKSLGAGSAKVRVKVRRTLKRGLRRARRLSLTLRTAVQDSGGTATTLGTVHVKR